MEKGAIRSHHDIDIGHVGHRQMAYTDGIPSSHSTGSCSSPRSRSHLSYGYRDDIAIIWRRRCPAATLTEQLYSQFPHPHLHPFSGCRVCGLFHLAVALILYFQIPDASKTHWLASPCCFLILPLDSITDGLELNGLSLYERRSNTYNAWLGAADAKLS